MRPTGCKQASTRYGPVWLYNSLDKASKEDLHLTLKFKKSLRIILYIAFLTFEKPLFIGVCKDSTTITIMINTNFF